VSVEWGKDYHQRCGVAKGDSTCKEQRPLSWDHQLIHAVFQGKYTVLADVYTKENEQITCLTAQVKF